MTTAREQAREAAKKHVCDVMAHGGYTGPEPAADAASDVWEPLLRNLLSEVIEEIGCGQHAAPSTALWDAVARAKEALG